MPKFNFKFNPKNPFDGDAKTKLKNFLKNAPMNIFRTCSGVIKKRELKIGARINLIIISLCITALIIGVLGLSTAKQINQDLNKVYDNNLIMLKALGDAKADFQSQRVAMYNYVLTEDEGLLITYKIAVASFMNKFEDDLKLIENTGLTKSDKELFNNIKQPLDEYKKSIEKVFNTYSGEALDTKNVAIEIVYSEVADIVEDIEYSLNILMATQVRAAENTKKEANVQFQKTRNIMLIIIFLGITIALILGTLLSRNISKPIRLMAGHAGVIAGGDFTRVVPEQYIKRKDEIGTLAIGFKDMQSQLNSLIRTIMSSAENLAAATQEMSASTEEITGGAQEQSDQIQQVSDNIQKVSVTAKQVTEKAQSAWNIAHKATETSQAGQLHIANVQNGMKTIDDTMVKLDNNSAKIGEIVNVISEIADQTNLLSLNAAIEAARAGEHGRGFAVVADEVRKLADRSAKATKEISKIIASIKKDTEDAVKAAHKGGQVAAEANQSFDAIHKLITGNADMVNEIVVAIEQVELGVGQVSAATEAISAVTEESAAGLEEISASAGDMSGMADQLQTMVQKFKIL